jgi:hypothetical protein
VRSIQYGFVVQERDRGDVAEWQVVTWTAPTEEEIQALPESAVRHMSLRAFDEHTFYVCSECVAFCPYGEEVQSHGSQ